MKCLSIQQPWAWLILSGLKDVENRSWPCHHRGPLLIHAPQKIDEDAIAWIASADSDEHIPRSVQVPDTFTTGAIVGQVEVTDCRRYERDTGCSIWHQLEAWGIYVRNPIAFPCPVESKGRLGLFDIRADLEDSVREQLERAAESAERKATA